MVRKEKSQISKSVKVLSCFGLIMACLIAPKVPVSADITLPPKGVSQELWQAYQEVAISNIDGGDRNLRWNTSPAFYIAGDPTVEDNNTLRSTLYEIFKYCANISPGITTTEPIEGAIFHYVPVSKFKSIIPEVPADAITSYSWSLYRLNSGLKKFTAVHSTATSQSSRDMSTQINVYRAMGLRGYTKNLNANMFSWTFPNSGVITASELDKQIIKLYCSTYSRSWDTSQQTFDAISSAWTKKSNIPIMDLNIKVGEYKNQLNFSFEFNPSSALDNQVTGIGYNISGANGMTVKSGRIDISENLFKSYQVILSGIKDGSRYKIEAFPLNSTGSGSLSKADGRAGTQPAPQDSDGSTSGDALAEVIDSRNAAVDATNAAKEAIAAFQDAKANCIGVSSEFDSEEQELFDSTNLVSACEELNTQAATLRAKILALDPDKAKTAEQANAITTTANLYAENSDALVAEIQDIADSLAATNKPLSIMVTHLKPLNLIESEVIDEWNNLLERISLLPSNSQISIKKSQNYKQAKALVVQTQKLIDSRDAQLDILGAIDEPLKLNSVIDALSNLKVSSTQITTFKKSVLAISKLIPANVCQKGALVVLASKSGKCAKGFELIPTL